MKKHLVCGVLILLGLIFIVSCSPKVTKPEETNSERMERARQQRDDVLETLEKVE